MDKKYSHLLCEQASNIFEDFEKYKNSNINSPKFTIILPPPNVTGQLHLGHAWNGTIQDCLIRYKNFNGFNCLWVCGMDHAGIATQTKFESFIRSNKQDLNLLKSNRENFISQIDSWKEENAINIRNQWKQMGFLLDYKNEKFTLDENSSFAVKKAFVDLYNSGLIYRANKLVNWDVKLKTAISNIEVIKKEIEGNLYYIRYPFKDSNDYLVVATTRPETIFVDECLFINSKDKRKNKIINKTVLNPLTNKELKILEDDYVDLKFGTGIMKCTPAHDFNDDELCKKYNLNSISCIDYDGKLNQHCGKFAGLDRIQSRESIIQYLSSLELIEKIEKKIIAVDLSERSNEIVEPLPSLQWFIKVEKLNKDIIKLQNGKKGVFIYPEKFNKMLLNWLNNMQDWCISRQLIWGHQIPAWYKKDSNEVYVGLQSPGKDWYQDKDVLDTWFSSGLWPLSTLGFPNELSNRFPTSVLVTAFDIIFFWVARMLLFSYFYTKQIPFYDVYLTGLIRDSQGKKMSKSLGNGIDPRDLIEKYGADSLRLFLLSSSSPGEDLKFSFEKIEASWNFLNKFWNSIRFIVENKITNYNNEIDFNSLGFLEKWILNKLNVLIIQYKKFFDKYNFLMAINKLTNFIKNDFCNTFIELSKFKFKDSQTNENISSIYFYIIKKLLVLLNPICPFFSSYIYNNFIDKKHSSIYLEQFPEVSKKCSESVSKYLFEILEYSRKFRFNNKLTKNIVININLFFSTDKTLKKFQKMYFNLKKYLSSQNIEILNISVANLSKVKTTENIFVTNLFSIEIINEININNDSNELLNKEYEKLIFEINRSKNILKNKNFLAKAPKELVKKEEQKLLIFLERKKEIEKILKK